MVAPRWFPATALVAIISIEALDAQARKSGVIAWLAFLLGEGAILVCFALALRAVLRRTRSWRRALLVALVLVLTALAAYAWVLVSALLFLLLP